MPNMSMGLVEDEQEAELQRHPGVAGGDDGGFGGLGIAQRGRGPASRVQA